MVYTGQIQTLQTDLNYRVAMRDAEAALNAIYEEGIQNIVEIMEEYSSDEALTDQMQSIAASA